MNNAELARVFERIRLILDLKGGENPFRIRAYDRAVQTIAQSRYEMKDIYNRGGVDALRELPGIGKDIALKIEELLKTGKLKFFDEIKKAVPAGLFDILDVEGMGPKRTKFVWETFKVKSLDDLERLAKSGKLAEQKGWGEKSVEKIVRYIALSKSAIGRLPFAQAKDAADKIVKQLRKSGLCEKIVVAGSLRREQDTVGDIDILATSSHPARLMNVFCNLPDVTAIHGEGPTKSSVALNIGIDADLRVVNADVFGAALQYFTGNKDHNVKLRRLAISKGMTINEYGVYKGTAKIKGKLIAAREEEDVYKALGLPWIPPPARFDRGEIEAALLGPAALAAYLKQSRKE